MQISVIIPVFNREHLLGETLRNLVLQTRPPDEVIVVDDGSCDGSADVAESFGDPVRLIRQRNAGPAAARNRGLAEARGDYIQFFDSDDLCTSNKLEVQARLAEQTGAELIYGPWLQVRLENGEARFNQPVHQQKPLRPERSALSWFLRDWFSLFQCCLVERKLLQRVGPFREDMHVAEDLELLFRIMMERPRIAHSSECLVLYRMHGKQISTDPENTRRNFADLAQLAQTVSARLAVGDVEATWLDRCHWRRRELEAVHAQGRAAGVDASLGLPVRAGLSLARGADQLRSRLGRFLRGSSQPASFRPGPLSERQIELIRALGYQPQYDLQAY